MNELRRVSITRIVSDFVTSDKQKNKPLKGYFHKWFDKMYENGSSYQYALIELDSGIIEMYNLDSWRIKFEHTTGTDYILEP